MPTQSPRQERLIPLSPLLSIIAEHDATWHRLSLQSVWVICPAVLPPNLLCTPNLFTGRLSEEQRRRKHSANSAQQQLKHYCAISIVLLVKTTPATTKKINSIPAIMKQGFLLSYGVHETYKDVWTL